MRSERRRQSQRTMRRNFRSLAASLTILIGHSQAQNACPTEASLTGFSTIASINDFMQDEILRIATGGAPESTYTITLCPNTDFDASIDSLKPVLSGVNFICGADGAPTNNCNIRGGAEQVRIEDSQVPDYPLSLVSFSGLTFESFGTSVNGSASETTTATFNDVTWKNFDSAEFVINLGRDDDSANAMIVNITGALVEDGSARTIFRNNGGFLNIEGLAATRVTASESIIATSNKGSSFLSDSIVTQSSAGSVTSSSLAGSQRVTQVTVSEMQAMKDTFFTEGAGSNLIVSETVVKNNVNPTSWNVVSVRSGAIGRVTDSSITGNTGIQSGVSATSIGSVVSLLDSVISDNSGLGGNETSTPVFALSDGTVSVERTQFARNQEFSAQALAFFRGFVGLFQSCFEESSSPFVAFVDSQSELVTSLNFVDDYDSDQCPEPGNRLFRESAGSGCFLGGTCEGTCDVLADQVTCQANPTDSPVSSPGSPSPTTTLSQSPITSEPTFSSTTIQPLVPPTSSPVTIATSTPTVNPIPGDTNAPTLSPIVAATNNPTTAPLTVTPVPTPLPTVLPSDTPTGSPTPRPTVLTDPPLTPSPTSSPSKRPSVFTASPVISPPTRSPIDVTQNPTKRLVCPDGSDPIRTPSPTSKKLQHFTIYEAYIPQMMKLGTRSRGRDIPHHMMKLPPIHTSYFADFHLDYDAFEFPEQATSAAADEHGRRQLNGHEEEEDFFFEYSCAPSEMPTPKPTYQVSKGKGKGKGFYVKYKNSKHKKSSKKKQNHGMYSKDKKHSKHHSSSKHSKDSLSYYKSKGYGRAIKSSLIQIPIHQGKGQENRPIPPSSSPTDGGESSARA